MKLDQKGNCVVAKRRSGPKKRKVASTSRSSRLDILDANIVALLQIDGRTRNTDLAERLGVAEGTVRNRIARMIEHGVIKFGVWADPIKIGYQNYAYIDVKVHPPQLEDVAQRLVGFSEITFIGLCMGAFDIRLAALFVSNEHMYEFITERLNQVPGILSTVTTSVMSIRKRDFEYPVPGATALQSGRPQLSSAMETSEGPPPGESEVNWRQ